MSNAEPGERIRIVRDHIRFENAHDLAAVMETFGSSAKYDDEPWDEHHVGRAAVQSFYEQLLRALPDLEIAISKEHVSSDAVIIECLIRGTHGGTWRDLPATGLRSGDGAQAMRRLPRAHHPDRPVAAVLEPPHHPHIGVAAGATSGRELNRPLIG